MAEHVLIVDPKDITRLDSSKLNADLRGLTPGQVVKLYQAYQSKELVVKVGPTDEKLHKVVNVWVNASFPDRAFVTFRE